MPLMADASESDRFRGFMTCSGVSYGQSQSQYGSADQRERVVVVVIVVVDSPPA